jgi:ATP-dependent RNA helicase DeaD
MTTFRQRLSFEELGLEPSLLETLRRVGYERPTPIQAALIPLVLRGLDVIGQARTGTGKTAAFALPLLQMIHPEARRVVPQALVLVPTRELAVQVHHEFSRLAGDVPLRCAAVYGGKSIQRQVHKLKEGVHVVVGTPGRIIDHLQRRTFEPRDLRFLVLDEADRMLDIGFRPDIERILRRCPEDRQTLLLSATVAPPIRKLALRYMRQPKLVNLSARSLAVESIEQSYFTVAPDRKRELLVALLERDRPEQAIIFCRTKIGTHKLFTHLSRRKDLGAIAAMHGDMTQNDRDRVMHAFRNREIRFLVATDVVGRGIDVTSISHIINYDIPEYADDYVHRVGRTGRMGRQGIAYTFVTLDQGEHLTEIERTINRLLKKDQIPGFEPAPAEPRTDVERMPSARRRRYRRAL